MASYRKQIADALVTVISGITGAPSLVVYRDTDVVHPTTDTTPCAIVTAGGADPVGPHVSGAGTTVDMGYVRRVYEYGVSIYRDNIGTNQSNLDVNATFIELCQKALDGVSLSGVASVDQVDIVRNGAWEDMPFKNGVEKSIFGILVYNSETRK